MSSVCETNSGRQQKNVRCAQGALSELVPFCQTCIRKGRKRTIVCFNAFNSLNFILKRFVCLRCVFRSSCLTDSIMKGQKACVRYSVKPINLFRYAFATEKRDAGKDRTREFPFELWHSVCPK